MDISDIDKDNMIKRLFATAKTHDCCTHGCCRDEDDTEQWECDEFDEENPC